MLVTCPNCHRKNRIPENRLTGEGNCGACKQALFNGKPVHLAPDNLSLQAAADIPLVIDFWAPWCGPCRQFAPVFEATAAVLEPKARLGKLNTEEFPELAQQYGIRSIPTLVIMRQGRELDRISGALSPQQFRQWVTRHL